MLWGTGAVSLGNQASLPLVGTHKCTYVYAHRHTGTHTHTVLCCKEYVKGWKTPQMVST